VIGSGSYSPLEHCPKAIGRPGSSSRHDRDIGLILLHFQLLCLDGAISGARYLR
jgi:hypothetical protein